MCSDTLEQDEVHSRMGEEKEIHRKLNISKPVFISSQDLDSKDCGVRYVRNYHGVCFSFLLTDLRN